MVLRISLLQVSDRQGDGWTIRRNAEVVGSAGASYLHALYELIVAIEAEPGGVDDAIPGSIDSPAGVAVFFVGGYDECKSH